MSEPATHAPAARAGSSRPMEVRHPVGRDGSLPFLRRAAAFEQRLVLLMGARLLLAVVSLGIALALDTAVGGVDGVGRRGLYRTVAFAFLATALYGLVLPRIRRPLRFAAVNIAADIAIVSCLVFFSGGPDSVFSFLYVLVAVYGAFLFDRRGALTTAGLGMVSYGALLLAAQAGWSASGETPRQAPAVAFTVWAIHAAAMALVAGLASFLAAELRRTGEALRQSTSDLRQLADLHQRTVESLMSGLLTTDPGGCITSFNPEAERITGMAGADAVGHPVEEILPGVRDTVIGCAEDGGPHSRVRAPYRNRRGESLHLGVAAYILKDDSGEPSGHVVIFQDVTEVVEMEDDLRRTERLAAVGELSASIAHEIRNPLASISGSIQLLRRADDAVEGVEAARLMDIVLRETDRLNVLITDFLKYARPGPPQIGSVVVSRVVGDVFEVLSPTLPEHVELALDLPAGLAVQADAAQLRQVLWNLALNGCQAMSDGGTLSIRARAVAGQASQEARSGRRNETEEQDVWVEIEVRDEGVGIDPEVLDQIFDPFFTTKPEGSGLGLATVHRIVEEHGGSIRLESSMDSGTTVRIRLQRAEASG